MNDIYCEQCGNLIDTDTEKTVTLSESAFLADGTYHDVCVDGLEDDTATGAWVDSLVDAIREER